MCYLTAEVREQMLQFAAEVIEQHQSQIKAISLFGMIARTHPDDDEEDEVIEVTASDRRLIEALCNSGQTQLKTLAIGGNYLWWSYRDYKNHLISFVMS